MVDFSDSDIVVMWVMVCGRSNRSEVFCKKSVLKNFAKLTRKHMC